jgi:hypothetical protein
MLEMSPRLIVPHLHLWSLHKQLTGLENLSQGKCSLPLAKQSGAQLSKCE